MSIAFGTGYGPDMKVELAEGGRIYVRLLQSCPDQQGDGVDRSCRPQEDLPFLHLVDDDDWENWLIAADVNPSLAQTRISPSLI